MHRIEHHVQQLPYRQERLSVLLFDSAGHDIDTFVHVAEQFLVADEFRSGNGERTMSALPTVAFEPASVLRLEITPSEPTECPLQEHSSITTGTHRPALSRRVHSQPCGLPTRDSAHGRIADRTRRCRSTRRRSSDLHRIDHRGKSNAGVDQRANTSIARRSSWPIRHHLREACGSHVRAYGDHGHRLEVQSDVRR